MLTTQQKGNSADHIAKRGGLTIWMTDSCKLSSEARVLPPLMLGQMLISRPPAEGRSTLYFRIRSLFAAD